MGQLERVAGCSLVFPQHGGFKIERDKILVGLRQQEGNVVFQTLLFQIFLFQPFRPGLALGDQQAVQTGKAA